MMRASDEEERCKEKENRKAGNKYRVLCLYKYLSEHTDQEHTKSTNELIEVLKEEYGIEVNRNTLGDDLQTMKDCGLPIEWFETNRNLYYYDGHAYDNAELKILADAIASAKFITARKSEALIEKLMKLTDTDHAGYIQRHIYTTGRVKTQNEDSYYIVDHINEAIDLRKKIRFYYFDYSAEKRQVVRHGGTPYIMSPYSLVWDGDYYYVLGFCDSHEKIQTFRVDRIAGTPVILEEKAAARPGNFDVSRYLKHVFRMYDTDQTEEVFLLCENSMMNAMIDKFGIDVETRAADRQHFLAKVEVCPSPTFYRWVFGWGGRVKIKAPDKVITEYRELLKKALEEQPSVDF